MDSSPGSTAAAVDVSDVRSFGDSLTDRRAFHNTVPFRLSELHGVLAR